MLEMFIEIKALVFFLLALGIGTLVYYKVSEKKEKFKQISDFSQILVLIISLIYITVALSKLDDISNLGKHLSVFINSNLYISIFALFVKVYNRIKS